MDPLLLLGVDGGGGKTEAWLARREGDVDPAVLGRGKSGSSNPRAVGLPTALANLQAAIDAAWNDAKLASQPVDCAVLAMSGAGHADVREQIRLWAERRNLARRLEQVHDADPVLAAGTPDGCGIAAIAGTGSASVGVNRGGRRVVVGGWGYWIGDEGSAFWIGRRALDAVARADDGRLPPTALTQAILGQLHITDPRGIVAALQAAGDVRQAIASLAPLVDTCAATGDAAARSVLEAAAQELAAAIAAAAQQLELGRDFPLALAGGVLCGSPDLREQLALALGAYALQPQPVTLVPHPAAGCILLAAKALTAAPRAESQIVRPT